MENLSCPLKTLLLFSIIALFSSSRVRPRNSFRALHEVWGNAKKFVRQQVMDKVFAVRNSTRVSPVAFVLSYLVHSH